MKLSNDIKNDEIGESNCNNGEYDDRLIFFVKLKVMEE